MLSFGVGALGASLVSVCIVLAALNPNRRWCVCFVSREKEQKKFAHLALSIFLTQRKAM